jgi:glucose/arabinose dehydrogenase
LRHKVQGPEYGGDGKTVGRCAQVRGPEVAFPGHWAPDGLAFYSGTQFPPLYRGGAFIAFHGSWNRAPLPQAGFNVTFVPFDKGRAAGGYTVFAEGFIGAGRAGGDALHRPTGLAVGPDGSLYVTDDRGGRLYRIMYRGS